MAYILTFEVVGGLVVRVGASASDGVDVVAQTQPVELVILESRVCLRDQSVEEVRTTLQVDEHFQRYDSLSELIDSRWREGLETRQGSEAPLVLVNHGHSS